MPAKHAKFSPSAADRWIRCPASHFLHNQDESGSIYSDEGTVGHALAEKVLQGETTVDELRMLVGNTVTPSDLNSISHEITITNDLVDAIDFYTGYVSDLKDETDKLYVEKQVSLTPTCWGTADALIVTPDTLHVIDLKMGKGVYVEAENNYQLRIYAAAAMLAFPDKDFIKTHIIQPRYEGFTQPSTETLTPEELKLWVVDKPLMAMNQIERMETVVEGPDDPYLIEKCNPHEKACRWCSNKGRCVALAEHSLQQAGDQFKHLVPPAESAARLTDDQLAQILEAKPMIDLFLKAVEEKALERIKNGAVIPGFKVVEGRSNRKYSDPKAAEDILFSALGEKAFVKSILSPAKALNALKGNQKAVEALEQVIVKPAGKPKLVKESNKKPAMKFSAEDSFSDFAVTQIPENVPQEADTVAQTSENVTPEPPVAPETAPASAPADAPANGNSTMSVQEVKDMITEEMKGSVSELVRVSGRSPRSVKSILRTFEKGGYEISWDDDGDHFFLTKLDDLPVMGDAENSESTTKAEQPVDEPTAPTADENGFITPPDIDEFLI